MATILFSAAGAAIGGSLGGTMLGLSSGVVGRAVGAALGQSVDQRLMGGSEVVETGRVDRFRLTGASEGAAGTPFCGRRRRGGAVIWASQFEEQEQTQRGGKGTSRPTTRSYSYRVSLALALCEGPIGGVARIWADGVEIAPLDLNMRVYSGDQTQLPDPKMEAVEGAGRVPAYRGTAYVVIEDLDLGAFGNRVPQFNFEVLRPDQTYAGGADAELAEAVRAVALMPGSGEYMLATDPAVQSLGLGRSRIANVNAPSGQSDLQTSLDLLEQELPEVAASSLIVSWFGDDLRAGQCQLRPMVEGAGVDAVDMPWSVSGLERDNALAVPEEAGRPVYGGTPCDASVLQGIQALKDAGQAVMFYPFILMTQLSGNDLLNPWTAELGQPHLPWRGRITGSLAPGQAGGPDGTAAAVAEVAQFVGTVTAADFTVTEGQVSYHGPDEWSYSRFILHNAALCAAAGGVDSFCIGSEMRSLTQLRGAGGSFPFVAALRSLAAEARRLLGEGVKLGYAADWSEYFGYHPQDGAGVVLFHLDPLWADDEIDFIGIDNYLPLSDWRDGADHADARWGAIHNLDYLRAGIEGGEMYDWYYADANARDAQIRSPIADGAHGEDWIYRVKDIRGWWQNAHHERIGGVRQALPTAWVAQSKPIWFTELGCAAIDKGTNQPNKFLDPKSSESSVPHYSNGARDDLIQMQYLRAMLGYWSDPANNPLSQEYEAPMLDMTRAFVWAWDARPYPVFPRHLDLWSDGENYSRGHWLNGRGASRSLASVVREICFAAGLTRIDTSALHGVVRGYVVDQVVEGRAALQPLMLQHGFDAVERDGVLVFRSRRADVQFDLSEAMLARSDDLEGSVEQSRAGDTEMAGRVRLRFVEAGGDYELLAEESVLPDEGSHGVASSEVPLSLTRAEGRQGVERWLAEARLARGRLRLALPPSQLQIGAGDILRYDQARYRVERIEYGREQVLEAVEVDPTLYQPAPLIEEQGAHTAYAPPVPVLPLVLDLPLLRGDETPHAPYLAITADPWPGTVACYHSRSGSDYALLMESAARASVGQLSQPLVAGPVGRWDRGNVIEVDMASGHLESRSPEEVLAGANLIAIGDGSPGGWELVQFTEATLLAAGEAGMRYQLSGLLRGQQGSEVEMAAVWPVGSYVVVVDAAAQQLGLAANTRGLSQSFRIGAARRGYDDPSYVTVQHAFEGRGLRPHAPVHLRALPKENGDLQLTWIRRSRIDGDSWDGLDVPLGEESEQYLLRVMQGDTVLREELLQAPQWLYSAADQVADGATAGHVAELRQMSVSYGPGAAARLILP
jgi:hypothetical protein